MTSATTAPGVGGPGQPLAGLQVVEIASFVAGPLAGLTLGQFGADVIRIDPVGGAADQHRWPLAPSGRSLYWAGLNKQKRSVEIDLTRPEGRELAVALATRPGPDAGIVLTNAVRGEWIGYEALADRRPDVIHARLTGLPDGAPAVDYTVNAGLGFPQVTGAEGAPVNHVLPAWDLLAGMTLALSIVVAERNRRITGAGEGIEISLWDVALGAASNLGFLAEAQIQDQPRGRYGNYYYGGFGRDFEVADGRVYALALSTRQWQALLDVTGTQAAINELAAATGADFTTDSSRFEHREGIAAILEPWFAGRPAKRVVAELQAGGIVCSSYRSFQEAAALDGPLVGDNPLLQSVNEAGIGRTAAAGSPVHWRHRPRADVAPAHLLGQDTHQVLGEMLGLCTAELTDLARRRVIGEQR